MARGDTKTHRRLVHMIFIVAINAKIVVEMLLIFGIVSFMMRLMSSRLLDVACAG